jgi:acetyl esterase/lipase
VQSEIRLKRPRRSFSLVEALTFGFTAVLTFFVVLYRRLFVGKGHPQWSFRKELVTRLMRTTFERMVRMPPALMRERELPTPIGYRQRRAMVHHADTVAGIAAEVFTPNAFDRTGLTILYFHGGGYVGCSPRTHRDLLSRMAVATGAQCIAVEYRKAPEHPFPAALDDCELAYRALLDTGVLPERIVMGGDSAGAALALSVLQRGRDVGTPMPRALILLSPWVDLTLSGASVSAHAPYDFLSLESLAYAAEQYLQGADPMNPLASPLYADLSGFPPMLVQTGGAELFFSENERLVERARAYGVDVTFNVHPGMVHVFANFSTYVPECEVALREIAHFVQAKASVPGQTKAA